VPVLLFSDPNELRGVLDRSITRPGDTTALTDAHRTGSAERDVVTAITADLRVWIAAVVASVPTDAAGTKAGKNRLVGVDVAVEPAARVGTVLGLVPVVGLLLVRDGVIATTRLVAVDVVDDALRIGATA
jgi:hypothetical protein